MSQDLSSVAFINYCIPFGFGLFLALVGLLNKYSTRMKYVYRSVATWVYLLLAAGGSLLFTTVVEVIGARAVENAFLNSIVLGLIGPTVFLGVISRLPPPLSSSNEIEDQLKTLYDYVYHILDTSISRKTTQTVELKIRDAGKDADLDSFLREVDSMLDAVASLTDEQKNTLRVHFDETAMRGEYAPIIRELIKYYDVDYIIKRLSFEYERQQNQNRLRRMIRVAIDAHAPQERILPEFVIAKVQALRKDPDRTLYYLEQAFQKKPALKQSVLTCEADWWILAGMTEGERQREKIEALLHIMDIRMPSLEEIKKLCSQQDKLPVAVVAIKRDNGDCIKISLRSAPNVHGGFTKWWIRCDGDKHLDRECADLDEVISYIEEIAIPVKVL